MSKLNIVVLYDRVLVDEEAEQGASTDKAPVTRTLDKKEVEDEVAEALVKLGHEAVKHELDGTPKSLLALARIECDLVFNLTESFADDDTADFKIAGFLELIGKRYTRLRHPRADAGAGQGDREEDLRLPRRPHAGVRQVVPRPPRFLARPAVSRHREAGARGRLDRHRVQRRGQLDPRADGAHGLAARQLRLAGADRGVHRRAARCTSA